MQGRELIIFDPGSFNATWAFFSAQLTEIKTQGPNLIMKAPYAGKTGEYLIPTQAFIDTIEANLK